MIIEHQRNLRSDGREIILLARRVQVLPFGPLVHGAETVAHDGRPGQGTGAMTAEICAGTGRLSLMDEGHGMADLVRGHPGDVSSVGESIGERVARRVGAVIERIQEGDAAGSGGVDIRADDDPDPPLRVTGIGLPETIDARILGRHIDVPRSEMFGDPAERLLDDRLLFVIEGGAGIDGESRRREIRAPAPGSIPASPRGDVAVEIQENLEPRGRPAVQAERLGQRIGRDRSHPRGIRPEPDHRRAGIKRLAVLVEPEGMIVSAGRAEDHGLFFIHALLAHIGFDFNRRHGGRRAPGRGQTNGRLALQRIGFGLGGDR